MKAFHYGAALCSIALAGGLRGAEPTDPAPPPGRPTQQELRAQFQNLTPEQRQARMKEIREKLGAPGGVESEKRRAEYEKLRQELQGLPPGERSARIQAWRQTNGMTNTQARPALPGLSPGDSEAKRKQFRERIESELTRLKVRQADGSITPEETRRLERMSEWAKRLESVPPGGPPVLPRRPSIDEQFPKPVEQPAPPAKPADPSAK